MSRCAPRPTLFPYTTLFRSEERAEDPVYALGRDLGLSVVPRSLVCVDISHNQGRDIVGSLVWFEAGRPKKSEYRDRKSTRLNSSHMSISYAVFCLKKKTACL